MKQVLPNVKGIHVDIRASRAGNGSVHFDSWWQYDSDPNDLWQSGPIDLPNGPDHYRLVFDLDDKSGRHLKFYSDPEDAMYVQVGSCPSGKGNGNNQIHFETVNSTKKKLTVKDVNRDPPCELHYMLRFDGDKVGKCPPYEYDPEIKNGGGGV